MARLGQRNVVDTSGRIKRGRWLDVFANGTVSVARASTRHYETAASDHQMT